MDWITTSGSSIDEAKSNALDQLGIVADEAEFEVINDVEKSFLGRVKTEARVRARVKPRQPAAKDDRRRRSDGRDGGRNRGGSSRRRSRSGGGGSGGGKAPAKAPASESAAKSRGKTQTAEKQTAEKSDSSGPSNGDRTRPPKGERAKRSAPAKAESSGNGTRDRDGARQQQAKRGSVDQDFSRQDQERVAVDFLEGILRAFEMDGAVTVTDEPAEDNAIEVAVTGSELGLLVGPKGATLNALQELTRTVVQREADGARTERLRVDVAGYRERRRAALADFARKIATDVLETGSEKVLEPMGPADRKVVHDTVNEMDGVQTGSEGEEPRRRVVIRPA